LGELPTDLTVKELILAVTQPTWEEYQSAFLRDGTLRDAYILDTTLDDWQKFIEFIKVNGYKYKFKTREKEPSPLPDDVSTIVEQEDLSLLSIFVNSIQINCHFFIIAEIELDLDPGEFLGAMQFKCLVEFLSRLSCYLQKEIRVTPENSPKIPIFVLHPDSL
jgi:hypothetical protein